MLRIIMEMLVNEIAYDDIISKNLLMIKLIIEENNIDEILQYTWLEIVKVLTNSCEFNTFFVIDYP